MTRERLLVREKEKKKEPLFSLYSHNLSTAILTREGKSPLGDTIPDVYLSSFQKGSRADRSAENTSQANFGLQMRTWLGAEEGKPGIATWVEKQEDPEVVGMLTHVGLKGTPEDLREGLQQDNVQHLISVINTNLQKVGQPPFSLEGLADPGAEAYARSLIFYANYLNPEGNATDATRNLIDMLVDAAYKESNGNVDDTLTRLQKIAPLLQVTGKESQHVLAALMVAKTHAIGAGDKLRDITMQDMQLKDEELEVLDFLNYHAEEPEEVRRELGVPYNVTEILQGVTPEPTPGHKYWIEKDIPADFAASLPREELAGLEQKKSFFVFDKDTKEIDVNPDAFDPIYALEKDERRLNTGHETHYMSQLLAMSAASAPTPEKQAALFKALGETILRAHVANPELVQQFLLAQPPESREQFADNDYAFAHPLINEHYQQLEMNADLDFQEKFGKPHTLATLPTPEEKEFVDNRAQEILAQQLEFETTLLRDFAQYPERQLAMEVIPAQGENLLQQFTLHINIPETVEAWRPRIVALQEALRQEPLTLTLEQMGQIDFLSHSINIPKVTALLRNDAPEGQNQYTKVSDEFAAHVVESSVAKAEISNEDTTMQLGDFFQRFHALDAIPPDTTAQRNEIAIGDATKMRQFSTETVGVNQYQILNERGELDIFSPEDAVRDPFLTVLMQDKSISKFVYSTFAKTGLPYNTLLAYVIEAAATPQQQEILFRNLFLQVAHMYSENKDLRKNVYEYVEGLNTNPLGEREDAERLFGNDQKTLERLEQLSAKLTNNEKLAKEDMQDMGLYSLPFNLQHIAQHMQFVYKIHQAS
ncbi:MAG TPA: hypothetical protein VEW42_04615 [Candidatus Eisenbacteria bacterium]|nr:hypothetical protein [Candidatus Eisenbacteria bacterium]